MYDEYARDPVARLNLGIRRRLAPLLDGDRRRIELMNGLLMSLPGQPDRLLRRRDRHGRQRLPRRPQRRAHADAVERRLERRVLERRSRAARASPLISNPVYGYQAVNVESQERTGHSLLNWMRRLIECAAPPACSAAARSSSSSPPTTACWPPRTLGRSRCWSSTTSPGTVQAVELDLSRSPGAIPIEMFGGSLFPRITPPVLLMMGPHDFYWFRLRRL